MQRKNLRRFGVGLLGLLSVALVGTTATAQTAALPIPDETDVLRNARPVVPFNSRPGESSAGKPDSRNAVVLNFRTGTKTNLPMTPAVLPGQRLEPKPGYVGDAFLARLQANGDSRYQHFAATRKKRVRHKRGRRSAPADNSGGYTTQKVFGPDTRLREFSTQSPPPSMICKLIITMNDGQEHIGSGILVSEMHVLTTGHCVTNRDPRTGAVLTATSIEVVPGHDSSGPSVVPSPEGVFLPTERPVKPFGSAWSMFARMPTEWSTNFERWHDWALLTLDWSIGLGPGWMGMNPNYRSDTQKIVSGYPLDHNNGFAQYYAAGVTSNYTWAGAPSSDLELFYTIDASGGQSGGPVWSDDNPNAPEVFAMHRGSADFAFAGELNTATRINTQRFNDCQYWIAEDLSFYF